MAFAKNKEERIEQKTKQIAHRIKLKKRLEKAKTKDSLKDHYPLSKNEESPKSVPHHHQANKPNPFKKPLEKAQKVNFQKEQAEFERQIMVKRYRQKIFEGKNKRRLDKALLYKKTSRGQPVLSHQITHLLSKIQK
jgi:hypothetical protein